MTELLLGAQVLALLGMVVVSIWGWKNIDPETRIRARSTSLEWTMSKRTALVTTPLIGLVVVSGSFALRDSSNADLVASLGLAVIVIYLLVHWSSTKRAAG